MNKGAITEGQGRILAITWTKRKDICCIELKPMALIQSTSRRVISGNFKEVTILFRNPVLFRVSKPS